MKKNKNIILLILLTIVTVILLTENQFSKTAAVTSQIVDAANESDQKQNNQSTDKIENTSEPVKNNSYQVMASQKEKHEFTENELKEIQEIRNEAKMSLAMNYAAMQSFKVEQNRYTTDLKSAGFAPGKTELNYKLGFLKQFHPDVDGNQNTKEDFHSMKNLTTDTFIGENDSQSEQIFRYIPSAQNINLDEYSKYCKADCTATEKEFEILLVLPLPNSDKVDVWTINEKKMIEHVLDGTN